jgi:TRAP transporter TAXI family solute receptor
MLRKGLVGIALAGALVVPAVAEEFVTIGTGGVTGVYYPTGGSICRLVNKGKKEHGVRCSVESTGGSVYNINTIRAGELEMGVAQSDWQYHAYNGTSKFKKIFMNEWNGEENAETISEIKGVMGEIVNFVETIL